MLEVNMEAVVNRTGTERGGGKSEGQGRQGCSWRPGHTGCADFAGATLDPDLESYHQVLSGSSWDVVTAVADSPQRLILGSELIAVRPSAGGQVVRGMIATLCGV